MTTSDNTQTELSFSNLAKEGLTLVDAKGRTIVPSSYQSDPNKLASILPASHPAIKSYDGDFITKEKLKKNYVAIPQNSIPIFNVTDPSKLEQKKVKKFDTVETEQISLKDMQAYYEDCIQTINTGVSASQSQNLYSWFSNNKNFGLVLANNDDAKYNFEAFEEFNSTDIEGTQGKSQGYDIYTANYFKKADDVKKLLEDNFKSEMGALCDTSKDIGKTNNQLMGGNDSSIENYTKYSDRNFQKEVNWQTSKDVVLKHINVRNSKNKDVEYVSNAKQLITALLKHVTFNRDGNNYITSFNSDANIMLLNDIDLDEMLEEKDGKTELQNFIEKGLTECTGKTSFEEAGCINKSLESLQNTESDAGISYEVLNHIWQKYFGSTSNDTKIKEYDNFNESFTNFIQIENFTGAIGGGGFAINNLKMDVKNAQFAGMFRNLDGAILDGIWMENAQVLSSGNDGANDHNAAILAKNLQGQSWVNVSATGQQFTINSRSHDGSGTFSTKEFLKF